MKLRALEEQDWGWVAEHIGCTLKADTRGIVSTFDDGRLAGAVIMDSWTPHAVQVHQGYVSPMALRGGDLPRAVCSYVKGSGRGLLLGPTPASNERACALNEKFGFSEVARIPDGFEVGVDYVIYGMRLDESCRWLQEEAA